MAVEVTASMVRSLRERTGLGLMDCKKALQEAEGDPEKAVVALRTAGLAKADSKSDRQVLEGLVAVSAAEDGRCVMYEVGCETDFVARGDDFSSFVQQCGDSLLASDCDDVAAAGDQPFVGGGTIEEARCGLVAKVGENVSLRRFTRMSPRQEGGRIEHYVHGGRIAVMVEVVGGEDSDVGHEMAMHIAASNPSYISPGEIPQDVLDKERAILKAKAEQSGKPENIIEKMVEGGLRKYSSEICLLQQPYVRDDKIKVEQLLQQHGASVVAMVYYSLGGADR